MRVSLKWLKDYVDIKLAPIELAEKLTMAGLEVKGIETAGDTWDDIAIGEVIALNPHPNADRLKLAIVNLGIEQVTTVCGAPNIGVGQKVPFARLGARLIDPRTGETEVLKPAMIRGIASEGMVCSEKELGVSESHEGIMVLPPDAPVGTALAFYLGDMILDLDVTPNRPDCLSVIGIARELGALTGASLCLPEAHYEETERSIDSFASVNVVDPDLCPRYCASLITGIKVTSSPSWLQQRLNSCGMRPINNVVDVTNYVMLEYGQPLHAFDYHKLRGGQICVRRAGQGETITTLDGSKRTLNPHILVIANKEEAVAVAGIMGGLKSEVTYETDTIVVESANFSQATIRRGCSHLQFQSEASVRFDKGLNSELPLVPLRRATQLLLELAGGEAAKGVIDVYPAKSKQEPVALTTREVKRLAGLKVSTHEIVQILETLGFECRRGGSAAQILVSAPYWRSDIKCSADLVEEVARTIGYEQIPMTRLSSPLPAQKSKLSPAARQRDLKETLRNVLAGSGFQEVLTYSLVSLEKLRKLSLTLEPEIRPLKVANPMTREQEYLRTSLRAGLLATLAHNQKFEQGGMRFFEIGKVFLSQGKALPQEKDMLCALLAGAGVELSWKAGEGPLDFFDTKGVVESLLNRLELKARFEDGDDETLLPGSVANVIIEDDKVGVVGYVHPRVAQSFELSSTICLIEIDLEELSDKIAGVKEYQSIPRFPSVTRDISLVIDEQVSYGSAEGIIQSFPLVTKVILFDLYRGEQIPEGKKSFAIRVVYQSPSHTLTDEEVDQTQEQMLARLRRELGATLRS